MAFWAENKSENDSIKTKAWRGQTRVDKIGPIDGLFGQKRIHLGNIGLEGKS